MLSSRASMGVSIRSTVSESCVPALYGQKKSRGHDLAARAWRIYMEKTAQGKVRRENDAGKKQSRLVCPHLERINHTKKLGQ